jgi:dihydropteroate synthase
MLTLRGAGKLLDLDQPVVMGILNCTPDSFYSVSRVQHIDQGLRFAEEQIRQGAQMLDLGGQSTRPGSERIDAEEETNRVIPLLTAIRKKFPSVFLSIDTFHASVAKAAIDEGIDIINDVSGGQIDPQMLDVVANSGLPFVIMHMRGTPQDMQQHTAYENVTTSVKEYLNERIELCRSMGIDQLIVDPGFGFSKTTEQSFQILRELSILAALPYPLMVGLSRKSMIYRTLEVDPLMALNGTTALHMQALTQGARILRVHDVRPAWETIRLFQALHLKD